MDYAANLMDTALQASPKAQVDTEGKQSLRAKNAKNLLDLANGVGCSFSFP